MKKYFGLFLILAFACLPSMANLHKFYVSITEIHYNQTNHLFEVSTKLFFDDLSKAILVEDKASIDDPIEEYATEIQNFLGRHFYVEVNNEKVELEFVGVETEIDAVWVHYQTKGLPTEIETVTVYNDVFVNLFPNQQNIINFFPIKGKAKGVKGLYLNQSEPKGTIQLK